MFAVYRTDSTFEEIPIMLFISSSLHGSQLTNFFLLTET